MKNILVTGATGFVGSFLCKKLLEETDANLYLLVRARGSKGAERRLTEILKNGERWRDRIFVCEGDVTQTGLGLKKTEYSRLQNVIDTIYHCAASIRFSDHLEAAMAINYASAKRILELVMTIENHKFERLNYVSTAYIAGNITEGFSEKDLDRGQSFNNTYEASKFESEKIIESAMKDGVPITVFRPSIVTGDSETGETHRNNIVFKFLKLFAMGAIDKFYCTDQSSLNLVPINYVVDAIYDISRNESCIGHRFHLVNRENVKVKHMITYLCDKLRVSPPEFYGFDEFESGKGGAMGYFYEYVRLSHHFADQYTEVMLEGRVLPAEAVEESYFDRFIEHSYLEVFIQKK